MSHSYTSRLRLLHVYTCCVWAPTKSCKLHINTPESIPPCHVPASITHSFTPSQSTPQADPMSAGTQTNQLILDIRKRKGIKPEPQPLNEYEVRVRSESE